MMKKITDYIDRIPGRLVRNRLAPSQKKVVELGNSMDRKAVFNAGMAAGKAILRARQK